jgi:hypothetical protein
VRSSIGARGREDKPTIAQKTGKVRNILDNVQWSHAWLFSRNVCKRFHVTPNLSFRRAGALGACTSPSTRTPSHGLILSDVHLHNRPLKCSSWCIRTRALLSVLFPFLGSVAFFGLNQYLPCGLDRDSKVNCAFKLCANSNNNAGHMTSI